MTEYEYQPGDEFRAVDNALALVTVFREGFKSPLTDGQWVQQRLRRSTASETPEEVVSELERLVNGLVYLGSVLIEELSEQTGRPAEEIIADCKSETERNIPGLGVN
jgi:hypothetical protein